MSNPEEKPPAPFPPLEEQCPRCGGSGVPKSENDRDEHWRCSGCRGCGWRVTEFGRAILDLVSRYGDDGRIG